MLAKEDSYTQVRGMFTKRIVAKYYLFCLPIFMFYCLLWGNIEGLEPQLLP